MVIKLKLDFILRLLFFAIAVVQSYILSKTFVEYKFGIMTGVFISIFMGIGMGFLSGYFIPFLIKILSPKNNSLSENKDVQNPVFTSLMKSKKYADVFYFAIFLIFLTALAFTDYEYWNNAKKTSVSNLEKIPELSDEYAIFEVEGIMINHEIVGYMKYQTNEKKHSYQVLASPLKNSNNKVWIYERYDIQTDINDAIKQYNELIKETNASNLITLKRNIIFYKNLEQTLESVGFEYSEDVVFIESIESQEAEIEKAYGKLVIVLIFGLVVYVLTHLIVLIRNIKSLFKKI